MSDRSTAYQQRTTKSNGTEVVIIGTKRLPADQLLARGRNHGRMLTGNPLFPELQTLLPLAAACGTVAIRPGTHRQTNTRPNVF